MYVFKCSTLLVPWANLKQGVSPANRARAPLVLNHFASLYCIQLNLSEWCGKLSMVEALIGCARLRLLRDHCVRSLTTEQHQDNIKNLLSSLD